MTSHSLRRKILRIVIAAGLLTAIGTPLFVVQGGDAIRSLTGILIFAIALGSAEEFYLQASRGEWVRRQHALVALLITFVAAVIFAVASVFVNLFFWGELDHVHLALQQLFRHLTLVMILVAILTIMLRVIGFVGGRTLLYLLTGYYHRPVIEKRVLAFVDIKNSTALVEQLGPLRGKEAISHLVTQVSSAVIENGGDIYLYTGDGLIASWSWQAAVKDATILHFARAALVGIREDSSEFSQRFGMPLPGIRIGIDGGDVVVSEQGDIRRAIGIWGDAINVAARLEHAGKELHEDCLISQALVDILDPKGFQLVPLTPIRVRGIAEPVRCCALRA